MRVITAFSQLNPSASYSYADYLTWKFDELVELIKGQVMRPMSAPAPSHQRLSRRLEYAIEGFLRGSHCEMFHAPFDVRLSRNLGSDAQIQTVVQPDICVVCDPAKIDHRGCLGAPDWIIEIVSPGNLKHDTITKFDLYQENGVREYWVVFPGEKTIQTFELTAQGHYHITAEYAEPGPMPVATLPGLAIEWAEVFDSVG